MNREISPSHVPVSARTNTRKGRAHSRRTSERKDQGFTLVELLIVITIMPLIVGALAYGLVAVFSLQGSVSARLGDSSDAQVVAASYTKDVESASLMTTNPAALCGSGYQLLGLEWGGSYEVVSYVEQAQSATAYSLVRNECDNGSSPTPNSSTTLSYDLYQPCPAATTCQPVPVAYNGSSVIDTSSATPVTTVGMTSLKFPITEPNSTYSYALSATPAAGSSTSQDNWGQPSPGASCGFALAGTTGSNTSGLCFIGFTQSEITAAYTSGNTCQQTDPGQPGTDISVDVPDGDIMTFCLTIALGSGQSQNATMPPMAAVSTPVGGGTCRQQSSKGCDWGYLSNGEGFLGNDDVVGGVATPFYAGIGCPDTTSALTASNVVTSSCIDPAIFQTTNGGLDTVTLSNIVLTDPLGGSASGFDIVTADAETIDPGGSIQWTSSLPASNPLKFSLIPNFEGSDLGNACNNVPASYTGAAGWAVQNGDTNALIGGTNYPGDLTGIYTATVKCTSTWQTVPPSLVRTGTAMLELSPATVNGVTEPVTISAQIQGEGYNAVAFGLLLSS